MVLAPKTKQLTRVLDQLPFTVDTWSAADAHAKLCFLSHAHKDHLVGLERLPAGTAVYCSELTARLVALKLPGLRLAFEVLEEGMTRQLRAPDGCSFAVTAVPAGHCPGEWRMGLCCGLAGSSASTVHFPWPWHPAMRLSAHSHMLNSAL